MGAQRTVRPEWFPEKDQEPGRAKRTSGVGSAPVAERVAVCLQRTCDIGAGDRSADGIRTGPDVASGSGRGESSYAFGFPRRASGRAEETVERVAGLVIEGRVCEVGVCGARWHQDSGASGGGLVSARSNATT